MSFALRPLFAWLAFALLAPPAIAAEEAGCPGKFSRLLNKADANWSLYSGRATGSLEEDVFAIFEKVRKNPGTEISAEELEYLKAQGLDLIFRKYQNTNAIIRKINQVIGTNRRSQPISRDFLKNWQRTGLDFISSYFAPGIPVGPHSKAKVIFQKAIETMNFDLAPEKAAFLKKWKLWDDFLRLKSEAAEYRDGYLMATRLRRVGNALRWGLVGGAALSNAIVPIADTERVDSEAALKEKLGAGDKGLRLIFSTDARLPAMLRTESGAVVFRKKVATFYSGPRLQELEEQIAKDKISYNQVFIRASKAEARRVMDRAREFVVTKQIVDRGRDYASNTKYVDEPMAEVYKILTKQLGMAHAPIIKRTESLMLTYLSLMKRFENPRTGRVKRIIRVRPLETAPSVEREALRGALDAYLGGMFYIGSNSAYFTVPMLGVDALPTTKYQKKTPLPPKPAMPDAGPSPGMLFEDLSK